MDQKEWMIAEHHLGDCGPLDTRKMCMMGVSVGNNRRTEERGLGRFQREESMSRNLD